jgi:hypothetical protein
VPGVENLLPLANALNEQDPSFRLVHPPTQDDDLSRRNREPLLRTDEPPICRR